MFCLLYLRMSELTHGCLLQASACATVMPMSVDETHQHALAGLAAASGTPTNAGEPQPEAAAPSLHPLLAVRQFCARISQDANELGLEEGGQVEVRLAWPVPHIIDLGDSCIRLMLSQRVIKVECRHSGSIAHLQQHIAVPVSMQSCHCIA